MNKVLTRWRVLLVLAGGLTVQAGAPSPRVFFEKPAAPWTLPLPAFAEVDWESSAGDTWRQSGVVDANFRAAQRMMQQCLSQRGWMRSLRIPGGKGSSVWEIVVWEKKSQRVLMMLWDKDVATTGFSWGLEKEIQSAERKPSF